MKGWNADAAGANSYLHLGGVEHPDTDPAFWAVMQTLRLARDCGHGDEVMRQVMAIVRGDSSCPSNSITSTLVERLQLLGWHVDAQGFLWDHIGKFSLFMTCFAELKLRAMWAWNQVIAAAVAHRPGLRHFAWTDPVSTRRWLKSLPISDRALMHRALNGTHFTQDGLMHCQKSSDDVCEFCESSDSRYHRFWVCPEFQSSRDSLPESIMNLVPSLPECVSCYGWALKPASHDAWFRMLATIPDAPLPEVAPMRECIHLFTDGSCLFQQDPALRFASFAVVLADPANDASDSLVVDVGHLPGVLQSSYRAEIYALLRAVMLVRRFGCSAHIWSDCEGVVKRFRRLLTGVPPRINSPHYDLWQLIFQECLDMPRSVLQITHVSAHREGAETALEDWCFAHNHVVDRAAVRFNYTRDAAFWECFHYHASCVAAAQDISRGVQQVILSVSQRVVRRAVVDPPERVEAVAPSASGRWTGLRPLQPLPDDATRWYSLTVVRKLLSWFHQVLHGSSSPVIWVSHLQLYFDYQLSTGWAGPAKVAGWRDGDDLPLFSLSDYPCRTRVRWFTKVLKETLRKCGQEMSYHFGRPASQALLIHTGSAALPWPADRLAFIDQWLLSHVPGGIRRVGTAIDHLPIAPRSAWFDPIFISSV